jgi:predicted RNA-binding protein
MKYWINVVSRDHVLRGVEGGFTQANHGKPWALRKMEKGDWLIFYSPKTKYEGGEPLQAFTAIGQIDDDEVYQVDVNADFHPWRRKVRFEKVIELPIRPLIDELEFIENKTQWGYRFRLGVIEINEHDYTLLKQGMIG